MECLWQKARTQSSKCSQGVWISFSEENLVDFPQLVEEQSNASELYAM